MSFDSQKGCNNEGFQDDESGKTESKSSDAVPRSQFQQETEHQLGKEAFPPSAPTQITFQDAEKQSNADVSGHITVGGEVASFTEEESSGDGDRDTWDNPIEFLLSCISMSVGLGNIWRFPGVAARNGGGSFLIPYLIVLLFIGRPLYYLEMCLGQFSKSSQVHVWNMVPLFKGVGYGSLTAVVCVCSYYCSLMAITTYYFFASFSAELPWSVCNEEVYGKEVCDTDGIKANYAELYFNRIVFPQLKDINNGIGELHWKLALCLAFSWIIILLSLIKGVKSSGKVAYFTALFPYLVLFILLIRGVTLPGAWEGIKFFISPQWDALLKPKVWYAAVEQVFFSLAVGFGPILMFSSFSKFKQDIYKDVLIISIMDTFTSLLAGFTVFSVMGNLAEKYGFKLEEMQGGPALAFIFYPQAIAEFDWAPQFFAVLFFLMLFTLGIGSATSLAGGIITIVCDQYPNWKRWLVTVIVCVIGCLVGLLYVTEGGLLMLDLVDHYGAGFIVYLMAIFECVGVAYVYGLNNFCTDIEFMLDRSVGVYWRFCWGFVIPIGLFANLMYYLITEVEFTSGGVPYPKIATIFGWMLTAFAVSLLPAWGIHAIATRKTKSFKQKIIESVQPTHRWGPQEPKLRRAWLQFRTERENAKREMGITRKIYTTIFG